MRIIAHRGYSAKYPENSLLAFEKAIAAGVDMIETDVRLSADDVPFIFHDSSLKRVANRIQGVEDLNSAELSTIDIGRYYDPALPKQTLPTLEALLKTVNARTQLILEIKHHPHTCERIAKIITPLIEDKLDWIEVSSFDTAILKAFHALNPAIRLHQLIEDYYLLERPDFEAAYSFAWAFDIDILLLRHPKTQALVKEKKVIFWTVDGHDVADFAQAFGAMSNDPVVLKNALKDLS